MDADLFFAVLKAFSKHKVSYRVIGGVALNLQGVPRNTEDLDIFVRPQRENIERLQSALKSVFKDPDIDQISVDDLLGDYPAVQYTPPTGAFRLDILTRLGERYAYDDIEVDRLEVDDILVEVATPQMLYRMKKNTVRPRDHADAARLRELFHLKDDESCP